MGKLRFKSIVLKKIDPLFYILDHDKIVNIEKEGSIRYYLTTRSTTHRQQLNKAKQNKKTNTFSRIAIGKKQFIYLIHRVMVIDETEHL